MMKRFRFDWQAVSASIAVSALLGMVFFFIAGFPKEKVWMGAIWAVTFYGLILPSLGMLQMIQTILKERNSTRFPTLKFSSSKPYNYGR